MIDVLSVIQIVREMMTKMRNSVGELEQLITKQNSDRTAGRRKSGKANKLGLGRIEPKATFHGKVLTAT